MAAQNKPPEGRKFRKGVSGNPGGRPKQVREVMEAFREDAYHARELCRKFMDDKKLDARVRVECMKLACLYGLGRPPQIEAPNDEASRLSIDELRARVRELLANEGNAPTTGVEQ